MENSILHLIRNIQNNNVNDMDIILQIFHPLLKSLSLKLEKEDTYQDLSLFLFTLIPKIPLSIDNDTKLLSYTALYNFYAASVVAKASLRKA